MLLLSSLHHNLCVNTNHKWYRIVILTIKQLELKKKSYLLTEVAKEDVESGIEVAVVAVYVWCLPCMNCKYWLTCGFNLLEHTSFDHINGREGNVCQRESLVNMSRPILVFKIIVIKIVSHSPTWLFTWTFSWTDLICVFRFSFYVNYLPHWLQGYLNF